MTSKMKFYIKRILDLLINDIQKRLESQDYELTISKKVKEYIIEVGYDISYGARQLRRTLQQEIEDPLSIEILKGKFSSGDKISTELRKGKILFRKKKVKDEIILKKE